MKKPVSVLLAVLFAAVCVLPAAAIGKTSAVSPSSWTAVDGLGRTLSGNAENGATREDRFVGMFYWIWHYPWTKDYIPRNTTEILEQCPEAIHDYNHPVWTDNGNGVPYFWDEPLFGYYSDLDTYVLRKHAELLADAGVDVIFFDTTNATDTFMDGFWKLCEVWEQAKEDGVSVPKVSFVLNFYEEECIRTEILQLYNDIYSKGLYSDLWFYWDGKPMLMGDESVLRRTVAAEKEAKGFFTFRDNEPTYFVSDTKKSEKTWGWCSEYPQTKFGVYAFGTKVEQMCVSVAQNADENGLAAMNAASGTVQGRSYAKGDYSYSYTYAGKTVTVDKNIDNSLLYGLNFQQQWDYAISCDPEFIFVTGFNEWTAGRFEEWMGTENAFPDQFSPEYSRDIEPSAGVLKDYYYYQLAENIRRYKGAEPSACTDARQSIDITAGVSQWESVSPSYEHYTGSTTVRDADGWKGTHYTNDTMRNDIVRSKVAYDDDYLYFCVQTADTLTSPTDRAWMRLFLDTDATGCSPSWEGFEYLIETENVQEGTVAVKRSTGDWNFETVATGRFTVSDNILQLEIPRDAVVLSDSATPAFSFKWSDNMQTDGDIMDFYQNGDVAPGGRFCFRFDASATGISADTEEKPQSERFFTRLLRILLILVSALFGTDC